MAFCMLREVQRWSSDPAVLGYHPAMEGESALLMGMFVITNIYKLVLIK